MSNFEKVTFSLCVILILSAICCVIIDLNSPANMDMIKPAFTLLFLSCAVALIGWVINMIIND